MDGGENEFTEAQCKAGLGGSPLGLLFISVFESHET